MFKCLMTACHIGVTYNRHYMYTLVLMTIEKMTAVPETRPKKDCYALFYIVLLVEYTKKDLIFLCMYTILGIL